MFLFTLISNQWVVVFFIVLFDRSFLILDNLDILHGNLLKRIIKLYFIDQNFFLFLFNLYWRLFLRFFVFLFTINIVTVIFYLL